MNGSEVFKHLSLPVFFCEELGGYSHGRGLEDAEAILAAMLGVESGWRQLWPSWEFGTGCCLGPVGIEVFRSLK